jgi:hypothetical protein
LDGVPWRLSDDDPRVDGEKLECRVMEGYEAEITR